MTFRTKVFLIFLITVLASAEPSVAQRRRAPMELPNAVK